MKARNLTIAIVLLAGALSAYFFFISRSFIPPEFLEARLKGAELAKNIVRLSAPALQSLERIAEYDQQGNAPEALILISEEVIKNRQAHQEAIKLASQLEKMARTIDDIKPAQAKVLATEAVSSEVALVSRLLSYNDYLLQLFVVLQDKFQKHINTDGRVRELVNKINEEALAINAFNSKFTNSLAEFDQIFAH